MTDNANGRPEDETAALVGETDLSIPPGYVEGIAAGYAESESDDAAEWRVRLANRIWQQQRRKAAQKAVRQELAVRRNHGLAARHAAKRRR